MSFTNLYYKRTAGTAKPCYVCSRATTIVLATKDSVDFFYTCEGHLKDPGFANLIGESGDSLAGARKLGVSDEEIQKIKEEYERRQEKKREKEKAEKEKDKDKGDDKGKDDDKKEKEGEKSKTKDISLSPAQAPSQSTGTSTPTVVHQRYTLHRDIFAMRLGVHRKRRQAAQAKEVAPRLPSAPRAPVTLTPQSPQS